MSTLAENPSAISAAAADDFQALEERILRTVDLLKKERERCSSAEQHASRLSQRIAEQDARIASLQSECASFERERDIVRQRVERLLKQLDEVSAE